MDRVGDRSSVVPVDPGLYVLRFSGDDLSHEDGAFAFVRPEPGSEQVIEIITPPGQSPGRLAGPGSNLVILATGVGRINLTLRDPTTASPRPASFRLEPLHDLNDGQRRSQPTRGAGATTMPSAPGAFTAMAHVSRRGDVEIAAGAWAGGPAAPAPIEGLEVRCGVGDVDVEVQALVFGEWSAPVPSWTFVGSRGRATPLTGVRLRLVGPAAGRYALEASALFLGSPVMTRRGQSIELVSFAGSDPLVGLQIDLKPEFQRSVEPVQTADATKQPRVRVFRAGA